MHSLNRFHWGQQVCAHDGKDPSLCFSSLSDSIADLISEIPNCGVARLQVALTSKSLQERAIDTVQRHPMEVAPHRLFVAGRK
jgi:hypothetical protein